MLVCPCAAPKYYIVFLKPRRIRSQHVLLGEYKIRPEGFISIGVSRTQTERTAISVTARPSSSNRCCAAALRNLLQHDNRDLACDIALILGGPGICSATWLN